MSQWDLLTVAIVKNNKPAEKKHDTKASAASDTIAKDDFYFTMMAKIQPSPKKVASVSRYIYHIALKGDWMSSAEVYKPWHENVINCCDKDRVDAYCARNVFHKEYVAAVAKMSTFGSRIKRTVESLLPAFLSEPKNVALRCNYYSTDEELIDSDTHVLIVIDTWDFCNGEGGAEEEVFTWNTPNNYPRIKRQLHKNEDLCLKYRLRFSCAHLTVALPHEDDVRKRMEKITQHQKN